MNISECLEANKFVDPFKFVQKVHWKEDHKMSCEGLESETETAIVRISGGPKGYNHGLTIQATRKGLTSKDVNISFEPPKKVNKEFDIKIQVGMGPAVDMMVYNKVCHTF